MKDDDANLKIGKYEWHGFKATPIMAGIIAVYTIAVFFMGIAAASN